MLEEPDERFMIGFDRSRDGSTLIIQAGSTSTTEAWLLDLTDPTAAPVPAGGRREGVDYGVEHAGDRLLVVHNDDVQGFALAQASLQDPTTWRTCWSRARESGCSRSRPSPPSSPSSCAAPGWRACG